MEIGYIKGDIVILRIVGKITEVTFSHYSGKRGKGNFFFDFLGNKYNLNQIA